MTWTNGRRLATISATNDHAALGFTYDSDGLRLTKTVGTEVHKYTWQGSKLISEQYGTTTLEFFYDESGVPYALLVRDTASATPTEAWYYYVNNLQGDVMQILDASGNTVASYTYNAWGKILNLDKAVLPQEQILRSRDLQVRQCGWPRQYGTGVPWGKYVRILSQRAEQHKR